MLIDWKDIKEGDELIIPSNSNLKYLKVIKLGKKSHKCTYQKHVTKQMTHFYTDVNGTQRSWTINKPLSCEEDISKHNDTFYLKDEGGYRDIWLVKREV